MDKFSHLIDSLATFCHGGAAMDQLLVPGAGTRSWYQELGCRAAGLHLCLSLLSPTN